MESPQVILVDQEDKPIGSMEKMEAHVKGELHRAFSVFLFNDKGQMLLQQRALSKYHTPGLWTNTCCSHPYPSEETADAAIRRLKEEMGITNVVLEKSFDFIYYKEFDNGLIEHEFDHVFVGNFNGNFNFNPEEVEDFKWMYPEEIEEWINLQPDKFTYWFKLAISKMSFQKVI